MATLTTNGASGTGTDTLSFELGTNLTREQKQYRFQLSANNGSIDGGILTVSQPVVPLAISSDMLAKEAKYSTNMVRTVAFTGTANGKYIKYEPVSIGIEGNPGVNFVSLVEDSSGSDSTITQKNTFVAVSNSNNGTYNFSLNMTVLAGASVGDYTVKVWTSDNADGTGALSKTFTITVIPYISIAGDDAIATADASNYSTYTATYIPVSPASGTIQWAISSSETLTNRVSMSTSGSTCTITILDTTASNLPVLITATNSVNSNVSGTKSITCTYVSTQNQAPFTVSPNPGSNDHYVSVASNAVDDSTPEITMRTVPAASINDITVTRGTGSLFTMAAIRKATNNLYVQFGPNTSTSGVYLGSVTLTYSHSGEEYSQVVSYSQAGNSSDAANRSILILTTGSHGNTDVTNSSGTLTALVNVKWINDGSDSYTFHPSIVLRAYDSTLDDPDCIELFSTSIVTDPEHDILDVTVAAGDTDTRYYTKTWTPTYPSGKSWSDVMRIVITVKNSTKQVATRNLIYEPLDI